MTRIARQPDKKGARSTATDQAVFETLEQTLPKMLTRITTLRTFLKEALTKHNNKD